jgi:hypothetical protein
MRRLRCTLHVTTRSRALLRSRIRPTRIRPKLRLASTPGDAHRAHRTRQRQRTPETATPHPSPRRRNPLRTLRAPRRQNPRNDTRRTRTTLPRTMHRMRPTPTTRRSRRRHPTRTRRITLRPQQLPPLPPRMQPVERNTHTHRSPSSQATANAATHNDQPHHLVTRSRRPPEASTGPPREHGHHPLPSPPEASPEV